MNITLHGLRIGIDNRWKSRFIFLKGLRTM